MSKARTNGSIPFGSAKSPGFYTPENGKNKIPGVTPKSILLTNEFYLTKSLHHQYCKLTFRMFKKTWSAKVFTASVFVLAASIFTLIKFHFLPVGIPLAVIGLYLAFMAFWGYLYKQGVSFKQLKTFYGDPIKMKVDFHPQYFTVVTKEGSLDFLYKQVTHYLQFTEFDILIVSAQGIIEHGQIIDKRSFEPEELNTYYNIIEKNGLNHLSK